MDDNVHSRQRGQSIILVAVALVALVIFVGITVDVGDAYYQRRTAQNAADGAALSGVRELGTQINNKRKLDSNIQKWMNDFAERNGIQDTDGIAANAVNRNVRGWYTDAAGKRLTGEPLVGGGTVPDGALGIEAITTITAPTFFGGIVGFDGYRLNARAVSVLKGLCSQDCVVPIALNQDTLCQGNVGKDGCVKQRIGKCLNIWDGAGSGNFGWLNWTWQELVCEPWNRPGCPLPQHGTNACDPLTLASNLDPDHCASGFIAVDDWASGSTGVMGTGGSKLDQDKVQDQLDYYLGLTPASGYMSHTFTVIIYDTTSAVSTTAQCNAMQPSTDPPLGENWASAGLHYHVAGFGIMQIIGYQLSNGTSVGIPPEVAIVQCENFTPWKVSDGFRITAEYTKWVTDPLTIDTCADPYGTMLSSPRLIE